MVIEKNDPVVGPLGHLGDAAIGPLAQFIIAVVIALLTDLQGPDSARFVIWAHVLVGVMWIGLLYYFNFVQVQSLAEAAADEGGPGGAGITKYVAPRALFSRQSNR